MEHARGHTRALCLRNGEEAIVHRAEVVPEERAGLCTMFSRWSPISTCAHGDYPPTPCPSSHVIFAGDQRAGACVCRVVLRLVAGVPRGAWVPARPAIDRAAGRGDGGCPVAGCAAPASDGRVRTAAWAGPGDGGDDDPGLGHGEARGVRGSAGYMAGGGQQGGGRSSVLDGE